MTTLIPKFDQGGTGAVNRPINLKLAETVSVKDFGAVGDGSTDDRAAIQAAIDYIESIGGGTVYFPQSTSYYLVSSTHLTYTAYGLVITSDNVSLKGEYQYQNAQIRFVFTGTKKDAGLYVVGTPNSDFRFGINLDGIYAYGDNVDNIVWMPSVSELTINDCAFTSNTATSNAAAMPDAAIRLDQTFVSVLSRVKASAGTGFLIGSTGATSTSTTFNSCYGQFCPQDGFNLANVSYSTLNSCACDSGGAGVAQTGTAYNLDTCYGIAMNGCGTEQVIKAIGTTTVIGLTVNGFYATNIGAVAVGNQTYAFSFSTSSGSISGINWSINPAGFVNTIPVFLRSFGTVAGNPELVAHLSVLDCSFTRSQCVSDAGGFLNANVYLADDNVQNKTYRIAKTGAGTGSTLNIPIISQGSNQVPYLISIKGLNGTTSSAPTVAPFSTDIGFTAYTDLTNITSNGAYGVTSVTASGMTLVITLTTAVPNVVFTIQSICRDVTTNFFPNLINYDGITLV